MIEFLIQYISELPERYRYFKATKEWRIAAIKRRKSIYPKPTGTKKLSDIVKENDRYIINHPNEFTQSVYHAAKYPNGTPLEQLINGDN